MSTDAYADRTVLVTGGAGGIGQAIVCALMDRGARVAVLDRHEPAHATLAVSCDVTDPDSVARAAAESSRALGPCDHLVCAAGVVSERALADLHAEEWRRVVDASLTGTYLCARAVAPTMVEQGAGSMVAISSGYARLGYRHGGHYAAAKAGIEAFVKSLAMEVAPAGVRANVVAPGPVLTDFVRHIPDRDAWRKDREARIPLGRLAEPGDIVGPVLFLLGPDSAYVTGQVLQVNGGLTML